MADRIPNTEFVKGSYVLDAVLVAGEDADGAAAEFDRWLAEHDRQVKADALRTFADETGVDASDRDDEYTQGYRQAQRYTLIRLGTAIARIESGEATDV